MCHKERGLFTETVPSASARTTQKNTVYIGVKKQLERQVMNLRKPSSKVPYICPILNKIGTSQRISLKITNMKIHGSFPVVIALFSADVQTDEWRS